MGWKTSEKCIEYRSRKIWWQFYRPAVRGWFSIGMSWSSRQKLLTLYIFTWQMNFIFPKLQGKKK